MQLCQRARAAMVGVEGGLSLRQSRRDGATSRRARPARAGALRTHVTVSPESVMT